MVEHGVPVPLQADLSFPLNTDDRRMLVGLQDTGGRWVWGGLAYVGRSRVVPWRSLIRLSRVSGSLPKDAIPALARALVELAHRNSALRLFVEIFEPDAFARERLVAGLRREGIMPRGTSRFYARTILIDLRESEEALLASFHATCRRHIKALAKHDLSCRPITDVSLAGRLDKLTYETMARTGGWYESMNWEEIIRYGTHEPEKAKLLGVFRHDREGEEALVGYVMGYRHGDIVEYAFAGSTRELKVPLLYAPTWELMRWGRRHGATSFDFGGVSSELSADAGATAGIGDFKRYFSTDVAEVGTELCHVPSAGLDVAARAAAFAASAVKRLASSR
jgi:hypothetical protein